MGCSSMKSFAVTTCDCQKPSQFDATFRFLTLSCALLYKLHAFCGQFILTVQAPTGKYVSGRVAYQDQHSPVAVCVGGVPVCLYVDRQ